jgi:uncharacterized protein YyaL (SSP411 family)
VTDSFIDRAGRWFLVSGIQDAQGGVARYYRSDLERKNPVSTEITGYAASTLAYLHQVTGERAYLERASLAAGFLAEAAWDAGADTMPFEYGPHLNGDVPMAYFFDSGIIVRGLLSVWRITGEKRLLDAAVRLGRVMARDFAAGEGEYHPILTLPDKQPIPRDDRWSRSVGCYQLKSAMAWQELFEATGEAQFEDYYRAVLAFSLRAWGTFLPGHPERLRVMDRLHAFSYFLEGMLPRACECRAAICDGIGKLAEYLRSIAPSFDRSDVYAQLLRARVYAEWAGVVPVDRNAAAEEAAQLAGFQARHNDPRIDGGFWFGRKGGEWLPYVNPVSTGFALQALALWQGYLAGATPAHRHVLI